LFLLRYARDGSTILRSHRDRLDRIIVRVFHRILIVWVLMDMLLVACDSIATAQVSSEVPSQLKFGKGWIALLVLEYACVNVSILPAISFISVYHAENLRLRLVMEDFVVVMRTEPFDFKTIVQAYNDSFPNLQSGRSVGQSVWPLVLVGSACDLSASVSCLLRLLEEMRDENRHPSSRVES